MSEIAFDKYELKSAYHQTEYFGPLHRINASTRAHYDNVCSDVIEHVREPGQVPKEMWRVLAPGGVLVVTTLVLSTQTIVAVKPGAPA